MSDELRWGKLYGVCGYCKAAASFTVDTDHRPHLNGQIGAACDLCGRAQTYVFDPTPEDEMARQAEHKAKADAHRATLKDFGPEEWPLFQCAMFGLMPQPSEPEDYTPDAETLLRWRLLRAENVGLANRVEEHHAND
jgi:hypothetical protein